MSINKSFRVKHGLDVAGNAQVSGSITANQFYGDGSQLTGITAENVDLSAYATITLVNTKQDSLVSGTNIKTINGQSLLGSGNILIEGGGSSLSSTDQLAEGSTNLYYTNTRVAQYLVANSYITAASLAGLASQTYVNNAINNVINAAPSALDTLNELAAALGNDANFASTVTTQLASKQATLVSGTNIKTINGTSLLGSGDIIISGGSSLSSTDDLLEGSTNLYYTNGRVATYLVNNNYTTTDDLVGLASETYVNNAVSALKGAAPVALDTLAELANAINNDPIYHETITLALNDKQNKLYSGTNIKTINGSSLLDAGNIAVQAPLISGTNIKTINGISILGSGNILIEGGGSSTVETLDDLLDVNTTSVVNGQTIAYFDGLWSPATFATESYVTSLGYATESWVNSRGFLNSQDLLGYATESWVNSQGFLNLTDLEGYATESYVTSRGYITSTQVDTKIATATSGLASTSYVDTAVSSLIDGAPGALNTLNELAAALGDDANFATTITNSLAAKANISSLNAVAFSGSYTDLSNKPVIPTLTSQLTNDSGYATQNWVNSQGFLNSEDLLGYATESFVTGQGYITSAALTGYATESYVNTGLSTKQDNLVSGTNIKTVNNQSILGSGNLTITADLTGYATESYVNTGLSTKQATLVSGTNIKTVNGQSILGSGNLTITTDLTGYATESYVSTQISNLVNSSPAALDTLSELASALGNDANFSTTITNSIATKAPINNPTFTGTGIYLPSSGIVSFYNPFVTSTPIQIEGFANTETDSYLKLKVWGQSNVDVRARYVSVKGLHTTGLTTESLVTKSASSTIQFTPDDDGSVISITPTSNFQLNINSTRFASNNTNKVISLTAIINQGSTPYSITNISIDGSTSITPKWLKNTAPTYTANNIDVLSLSLIFESGVVTKILASVNTFGTVAA